MGAHWKDIKEIAEESDFLFMMLGYPHDVEDVVFNNENGLLHHMKEGAILIDHTTSSPGQAVRIHEEAL
jgi:3-hydroxyisobutyrate dehydrogenase